MSEPNIQLTLAAALTLGLAGNVHCLAMCGGIAAAFSGMPNGRDARPGVQPLLYNLGRVASYAVAGAIAGSIGFLLAELSGRAGAVGMRLIFGLTMIGAGLYLAGWSQAVTRLEGLASPVWRHLSKAVAPLRPVDRPWKALALGAIWGWLPCGLTYTALLGAAASGSGERGALLMASFGLGTLPGMLFAGALAERFRGRLSRAPMRAAAGLLVILLGAWTLSGAAMLHLHWDHARSGGAHTAHNGGSDEEVDGASEAATDPSTHPHH